MRAAGFLFTAILICRPVSISMAPESAKGPAPSAAASVPRANSLLANEPLQFIPNAGQFPARVSFSAAGREATWLFSAGGMTIAGGPHRDRPPRDDGEARTASIDAPVFGPRWAVTIDFLDARQDVEPEGLDGTGTRYSYFKGRPDDWRTGIEGRRRILYRDLWPGVDLVFTGGRGSLKYELTLQPGADPGAIGLLIRRPVLARLKDSGTLVLEFPGGRIEDGAPSAFQVLPDGSRRDVPVRYRLQGREGGTALGFVIGEYDPERPVVIDPVMTLYCGFVGGGSGEGQGNIAVDGKGAAYIVGQTGSSESNGFPVAAGFDLSHNGSTDVFIAKIKKDGSGLEFCTFLGGKDYESGRSIALDDKGDIYITGVTYSNTADGFPVVGGPDLTFNGISDAFVAKLTDDGRELAFSGYIGGSDSESGKSVAIDGRGYVYVAGETRSSPGEGFPVKIGPNMIFGGGAQDGFVAKVEPDGRKLAYCGYIGGLGSDSCLALAVDGSGAAILGGTTESSEAGGFPVRIGPDLTFNGAMDAFVAKVRPDGLGVEFCGYIGGLGIEAITDIALGGKGEILVVGQTTSSETKGFPVKAGPDLIYHGDYDAFVAKIRQDGGGLEFCGYIGGSDLEHPPRLALGEDEAIFIAGTTYSSAEEGFPVTGGPDVAKKAQGTAFVAKLLPDGREYEYCIYLANLLNAEIGLDVDPEGNAYLVGDTFSSDLDGFPVWVGPFLRHRGNADVFVAKIGYPPANSPRADLRVNMTADDFKPIPGNTLTFTITVTNDGPSDASGIAILDRLPQGIRLLAATATLGFYDPTTHLWNLEGLPASGGQTLQLRTEVVTEGSRNNTARLVRLDEVDPDDENNATTLSIEAFPLQPPRGSLTRIKNDMVFYVEYVNVIIIDTTYSGTEGANAFRVFRKRKGDPDGSYQLRAEVDWKAGRYLDRGLKAPDLYSYKITKIDRYGRESAPLLLSN